MVKLKAVSVIETVAAMVIVLLVFWIAGSVFYFVSSKKENKKRHEASIMVEFFFSEKIYLDNEKSIATDRNNSYIIKSESIVHDTIPGVTEWVVKVYDRQNRLLITRSRFIKNEDK